MEMNDAQLVEIWRRANPPALFRREGSLPILVRLPFASKNGEWLRGEKRHRPHWNSKYKCWECPVAWFDWLALRLVERYSQAYLIQIYREQQKCAPACWNAHGLHCECSCMGQNHGTGNPGRNWFEVSETFAFEWGPKKYACRLISRSTSSR